MDLTKTLVDVLLTDLDLAMTFLDVAATIGVPEHAERNYRNAEKAYRIVVVRLQDLQLTEAQQEVFDNKLAALRLRLQTYRRRDPATEKKPR